eukprot:1146328-Pelagomonas_calceolata.AAC.1
MKQGTPISLQEFTDDLRHRLHGARRAVEGVDPQTTNWPHIKHSLPCLLIKCAQAYPAARVQVESSLFDCGNCVLGGWDFSGV